jgi:hypothetical protein
VECCPNCAGEINGMNTACPVCGKTLVSRPAPGKMIAVGSYCSFKEAQFNQTKLDAEGIRSLIVRNEKEAGLYPYSQEISGFYLQVDENEAEESMSILMDLASKIS